MDLKKIRSDRGQTQEAFAEDLSVSQSHVADMERGRRKVSLKVATRLVELTGDPGILAGFIEERTGV